MILEKYHEMNCSDLYKNLLEAIMTDFAQGKALIEKLSDTKQYKNSYEFRACIETARAILLATTGENAEVISLSGRLIEVSNSLKMWQLVSTNLNLLGAAYMSTGLYEKALKSYYQVIENEKKHHLNAMISTAYNNLASIYKEFDDITTALEYLDLAIVYLNKGDNEEYKYKGRLLAYRSNMVTLLYKTRDFEKLTCVIQEMDAIFDETINNSSKAAYFMAKMYGAFTEKEHQKAKEYYFMSKSCIDKENLTNRFSLLGHLIELCNDHEIGYEFYLDELLEFEKVEAPEKILVHVQIYKSLIKYYSSVKNNRHLKSINDKYIRYLEKETEQSKNRQKFSLNLVKDTIEKNQSVEEFKSKNTELEHLATEAIHHKNLLEKAYSQIEMISELGNKITSSLKLREVIDLIYKNIDSNIPIDSFILTAIDKEDHRIKSVAYYEDKIEQPEFEIELDNQKSIFSKCYYADKIISTADEEYKNLLDDKNLILRGDIMLSVIYMPLKVDHEIVGLFSIQNRKKDVYTKEHIEFLEKLSPYLSIALNNALYSRKLEKEIQSHLQTQEKLRKANQKLEQISSLDGLTQINSRREFDIRIAEFLDIANRSNCGITLFMLDIDNFKLYNDTYGHLQGDEVLKRVAKVFRSNLDEVKGLSARFGGEEFIGACLGLSVMQSEHLANKIRTGIQDLRIIHKATASGIMTVSIGVCVSNPEREQPVRKSMLMKLADISLYEAKNAGKNATVLHILP